MAGFIIRALKQINNGLGPDDGTGDTLRTGAEIINDNFDATKTVVNSQAAVDVVEQVGNGVQVNSGSGVSVLGGSQTLNANSVAIAAALNYLAISQASGALVSYLTKADMDADLAHDDGVIALVTNDPTPENNQSWRKSGGSGSGSWEITIDRMAVVLGNGAGFQQLGAGSVLRTYQDKGREWITPDDFTGADDTAKVNAALATGRRVRILAGKTYSVTTLNMAVDGTSLDIEPGGTISLTSATVNGFYITGNGCSITGGGTILSPATWDSTNSRRTFATIWVAGDNFSINGVTLNNIPRSGIHFEDATNGRVENCHLLGNFPYADWVQTNTGHMGIDYNPPSTTGSTGNTGNGSLVVVGNRIEGCVQGFHVGNYDAAAEAVGIVVSGNSFNRCWNHGIYAQLLLGATISGNNFTNCQTPIVADGSGSTVTGNSIYATETSQSNGYASINVRDAQDVVIADNNLYGMGASIYADCITGTVIRRVSILNNTIHRTAPVPGVLESAIRIGSGAQTCEDCTISGNTISGIGYGTLGVIVATIATTYTAIRTKIANNRIYYGDTVAGGTIPSAVYVSSHNYATVTDNDIILEVVGSAAAIVYGVNFMNSSYPTARNNRVFYTAGGTNISVRGIMIQGSPALSGRVTENEFFCTSASLTAVNAITYVGSNAMVARNRIDGTARMAGAISWTSGTASVAVSNTNALAVFSRVLLTPTNSAAGAVMAAPGIKAVITDGTITVSTADGTNLANTATFTYTLD